MDVILTALQVPGFVLTVIGAAVALAVDAVPAFAGPAAATLSAIVVPGGRDTLRLAGVPDSVPAGLVLPVLVRLLHADPAGSNREQDERLARVREKVTQPAGADAPNERIAVPLDESGWAGFLVGHDIRPEQAFAVLLLDREPALALVGLSAMSPSTRAWLLDHADVFHRLASRPGLLCAFGRSLRVEGDAVAVPGGATAVRGWEAIAGVAPADAVRFVDTVFSRNEGKLAAFYDAVARLTTAQQVAVVGRGEAEAREAYAAFVESVGGWRPAERPFAAPLFDGGLVLDELAVN